MAVFTFSGGTSYPLAGAKIYSGGTAVTIPGSAKVYVSGSWYDVASPIISGGTLTSSASIAYPGVWSACTIIYPGELHISSGGIAYDAIVNSSSDIYISSGGTAYATTVNSKGRITVSSGGTANSSIIAYRGSIYVCSGGTALDVNSSYGSVVTAEEGAVVTYTS